MRAQSLSLVTVLDTVGPELDRAETVKVFNDLVVLAPGVILCASVAWEHADEQRVREVFTQGPQPVSAELVFDARHRLIDFVSRDRLRASDDGTSFTRQDWSTRAPGARLMTSSAVSP